MRLVHQRRETTTSLSTRLYRSAACPRKKHRVCARALLRPGYHVQRQAITLRHRHRYRPDVRIDMDIVVMVVPAAGALGE